MFGFYFILPLMLLGIVLTILIVRWTTGPAQRSSAPSHPAGPAAYTVDPRAEARRDAVYADLPLERLIAEARRPAGRLADALEHLRAGRPAEARALLDDPWLELDSCTDEVYWWARAAARRALGDRDGAAAAAREVLGIPGVEARTRLQAWAVLRAMGHHPGADEGARVLGVVAEKGLSWAGVAMAAFADGEAHAVWSMGGGTTDVPRDPDVRAAAAHLAETADAHGRNLPLSPGRSWPARGRTRITLLTPAGPRAAEEETAQLELSAHRLHPLWTALQRLATALRRSTDEVLRVKVTADGRLRVNGRESSLLELRAEVARLKETGGEVVYYRDPAGDPPALAGQVIQTVTDGRLPIRVATADFEAAGEVVAV